MFVKYLPLFLCNIRNYKNPVARNTILIYSQLYVQVSYILVSYRINSILFICYPVKTYKDYPFLALFCYPIRIYLFLRIEKCVHRAKQQVSCIVTTVYCCIPYTFVIIVRKRLFIIWCKTHLRLCTIPCIYSTMIIGRGEALPLFVSCFVKGQSVYPMFVNLLVLLPFVSPVL